MLSTGQWRRAMSAGLAFVVLFVVGIFLNFGNSPDITSKDTDASADAAFTRYLSSSGHRTGLLASGIVFVIAAMAFVWFTGALRKLLSSTEAARLVSALGVLGAGLVATGAMINATPAGVVSFGDEPPFSGQVIRGLMDMLFPFLLIAFGLVCAGIVGVLTVDFTRSRLVPRWLAYSGWLAVVGGLLATVFLPFAVTLLWFVALATAGLVRPPVAARATALDTRSAEPVGAG